MIEFDIEKQLNGGVSGKISLQIASKIEHGQFVTLYGKSGAGKTSILRILAGLMSPEKGRIVVNGTTWTDTEKKINLPPQQRNIGFVFQDYALFPHLSVGENLLFALKKGQAKSSVEELLVLMELETLKNQKPANLSGGQQQRVALARALVQRPSILLLDEPLSALDQEMRRKLQTYLLRVHEKYDLTTILVSHDISEIFKMADVVLEIEQGEIVKKGKPKDLFPLLGALSFTGKVVDIGHHSLFIQLYVQIGEEKIIITATKDSNWTIGDKITINAQTIDSTITKH